MVGPAGSVAAAAAAAVAAAAQAAGGNGQVVTNDALGVGAGPGQQPTQHQVNTNSVTPKVKCNIKGKL